MKVTKAYDVKELGQKIAEKAKAQGLTIAEEALETLAKSALEGTVEWAEESAALTPNPIDDVLVKGVKQLQTVANETIEKIDIDGDGK